MAAPGGAGTGILPLASAAGGGTAAATADEELALQLHKQLNAAPLRARRGGENELAHQQSLDRYRRELASKPRTKQRTTTSSSQDVPVGGGDGRKQRRTSDPDDAAGGAHTSSRRRRVKQEEEEEEEHTTSSGSGGSSGDRPGRQHRVADSSDVDLQQGGSATLQQQLRNPAQAAAAYAARLTLQHVRQQHQHQDSGHDSVKVFYAGMRWGVCLPRSAVRTRQQLARALHNALVGEIVSVGQGQGLHVVFVDASGRSEEVGPSRSSRSSSTSRWRTLAQHAVRVYVR